MKKYLIIVVIVLVSLVGGLYLFSKIKNVDKIINNENEYPKEIQTIQDEQEVVTESISEVPNEVAKDSIPVLDEVIKENVVIENVANNTTTKTISKSSSTTNTPPTTSTPITQTEQKQVTVEQNTKPTEPIKQAEPPKQIELPKEPPKSTEEFKPNMQMAQTMMNIINSSPSQFMIDNGYSVIIDSSIVTQTNQFTFTEQRVKDKTVWKCGTIKVYARDYYVNGNYVWTECYLI